MKILTIGQGEIGAPLTKLISEAGHTVYAKDLEPLHIDEELDIMLVSIPFKDKKTFCQVVTNYAKQYSPNLIIINSTVLPGTSQFIEATTRITTAHSPVLGRHRKESPEMMLEDISAYPKFYGINSGDHYKKVEELFISIGLTPVRLSNTTVSELSKLLETTYSGILIGWMQEVERLSNEYGVDWNETLRMIESANERIQFKRPTNIYPGLIGGHCIMPNIALLLQENNSDYLSAVVESNTRKQEEGELDEVKRPK